MSTHHHDAPFGTTTPWPIYALGMLLLATLAVVAWERVQHANAPPPVEVAALWERSLRFQDTPEGAIAVIDANTSEVVARYEGEHGFLRGSLRALTRERALRNLGPAQPFQLVGHVDGRLTLRDPATGQRIALESFGPTNAAVYARLRDARPEAVATR